MGRGKRKSQWHGLTPRPHAKKLRSFVQRDEACVPKEVRDSGGFLSTLKGQVCIFKTCAGYSEPPN